MGGCVSENCSKPNEINVCQVGETRCEHNDKKTHIDIGLEVGKLVEEKQKAYGDSFGKSGEVLKHLYPDGIKVEQYTDMLCIIRILDKLFRIATNKDAFGESPYRDVAGYALLGIAKDENK